MAQVFSGQWHEFLHATADPDRQVLRFTLADLVPPHISAPVLTAFSLHLQVQDDISAVSGKPYLRLRLGAGMDVTFGLNAHADYTQVVTTRPPIEAITGSGTLEFILGDTPADLRLPPPPSPGHLNPAVLENVTLVLLYQGKITWSERSR